MPGRLTISFDFELGWGVLDSPVWLARERAGDYRRLRDVFGQIIETLKEREVATTWGVVAAMLIDKEADLVLDHLPEGYLNDVVRFYSQAKTQSRFGGDLIEQLLALGPLVEIASHSTTHFYPGRPDVSREACVEDILRSIPIIERFVDRKVSSIIFPRDQVEWCGDIAAMHRGNYRVNPAFSSSGAELDRFARKAKGFFGSVPESATYTGRYGEAWQSGSLFFNCPTGKLQGLRKLRLKNQLARMMNHFNRGEGNYHVWLHPFNLSASEEMLHLFLAFIEDVSQLRNRGLIEILSMGDCGDLSRNLPGQVA